MVHTENRIKELGLTLPEMPKPLGSYCPVTRSGNLLFLAGHIPFKEDMKALHVGKVCSHILCCAKRGLRLLFLVAFGPLPVQSLHQHFAM